MNNLTRVKKIFIGLLLSTLLVASSFALVSFFENKTLNLVYDGTSDIELSWLDISTEGTKLIARGLAPDEANRFVAISKISSIINPKRIIDEIVVEKQIMLSELNYSLELLRDDDNITAIGFTPSEQYSEKVILSLETISKELKVINLLEVAPIQLSTAWEETLDFAIQSMKILSNSKISLTENEILILTISESANDRIRIENEVLALDPGHFKLNLEIQEPRPLIQPFALKLTKDSKSAILSDCSATNEYSKIVILNAAAKLGIDENSECKIGIGAPSKSWMEAVITLIDFVKEFEVALVKVDNHDIDIVLSGNIKNSDFRERINALEKKLPHEFVVNATIQSLSIEQPEDNNDFVANLGSDGVVQISGFLPDQSSRIAVTSYAKSIFGLESVKASLSLSDELPNNWSIKVLAGLEVLGSLHNGNLIIKDNNIFLEGQSAKPEINEIAADILSKKLASNILPKLNLKYDASLVPKAEGPNPEKCVSEINNIIETYGIEFAPGEIVLQKSSNETLDKMAEVMKSCYTVPMEIGGHTDSQGRKSLNLSISQARAEAVMDSLLSYDILTGNLVAKGFGESTPIADNKTVEGRHKNRRIEFTLIKSNN